MIEVFFAPFHKLYKQKHMASFEKCASCSATSNTLLKCVCLTRPWYCNSKCQKDHWPIHKLTCKAEKEQWVELTSKRKPCSLQECLETSKSRIDFSELFKTQGPLLPSIADLVKQSSRGNVRLENRVGRGRCLISAVKIKKHETILVEEAQAWLPANLGDELSGALIPGLIEYLPLVGGNASQETSFRNTILSLLRLEPICIDSTPNKYIPDSNLCDLLLPISQRNVVGVIFDDTLRADERSLLIYPVAMLMANHSCMPNASWSGHYSGRAPAVKLIAERDIDEGEEITISYVPRSLPLHERRESLQSRHNFLCTCARCLDEEKNPEAALVADTSQKDLDSALNQCGGNLWDQAPAKRCDIVERALSLHAVEVRGKLALWDLVLLCGHVRLLAGKYDLALDSYTEAAQLVDVLRSSNSILSKLIRDFAASRKVDKNRSVKHLQSEIIAFEQTRSTRQYSQWEGLPDEFRERFLRPIRSTEDKNDTTEIVNELVIIGRNARNLLVQNSL